MELPTDILVAMGMLSVIGLIVVAGILSFRTEKQRTADLQLLAEEMSLSFSEEGSRKLVARLEKMSVIDQGHDRQMKNFIQGEANGVDLSLFDYHFTIGRGKNRTRHSLSIAAFSSSQLSLPEFTLGGESFLHRIASTFGSQDIDFAGHPAFNKKYLLRGPSEAAIRELFTENVIQHFEDQLQQQKRISDVEGYGSLLMVSTSREKVEDLRTFWEHAFAIYGILKSSTPAEIA